MKQKKYLIPIIYFIFGIVWLFFTDIYLHQNLTYAAIIYLDLFKGVLFILFSTFLIYLLLKKHTDLKQLEAKQNELTTLINSMPDFVCFKDGEGRWVQTNDFGLELYNLKHVNYKGKTDVELAKYTPFFKEALEFCVETDEHAWKEGVLTRNEESFPLPTGKIKTFDVIKVPLFYPDGKRQGLLTLGRDISVLKEAEQLLLTKEKLSVVGELSAGIAHEIRNPLTSIKGFIQLLQETKDPDPRHFELIMSEIERINEIVSELLILSKPQPKVIKKFPLNDVLKYVNQLFSHEATLHKIKIHLNIDDCPHMVVGDENGLKQVFINIVKNAMDAMDCGGEIEIYCERRVEDSVNIIVKDNGKGMPKSRLERLGEPFFTSKEKGMGLGLTITKKIINDFKGDIKFESAEGEGTTVTVTLPVAKMDEHIGDR
ncbi:ATP-binding protein [Sutcliffiella sp. NC1]|uniref:ATP-binding protein n=1 Tax=Sutcliffiella sp. NC1 TaxID=3004096 RepID=UPI0022DD0D87|nr:ATP-binding protein [Sutcliffiella sp. NC1]WBL13775.1 ATP-binding protein [Sutcliffiella sp. NC1]